MISRRKCRDHPRGCGAHTARAFIDYLITGSSPRVRGSHHGDHKKKNGYGIIPAGAGLTFSAPRSSRISRDHPRGCGAHSPGRMANRSALGSSPRVRGSPRRPVEHRRERGIIPAGAGLTPRSGEKRSTCRDHPRGCGAHGNGMKAKTLKAGSSPRVRGSPKDGTKRYVTEGIIPAGAGLTRMQDFFVEIFQDHPRGCGAHASRTTSSASRLGSSPRVRGSREDLFSS